ncbi:MAG TPA: TolC family protein [Rhabdochlamydiaceae bacterium]
MGNQFFNHCERERIGRWACPVSFLILLLCGGCYPDRAVVSPYSYAPRSPSKPWTPPSSVKPMPLSTDPPELPKQEEPYSLAELIDIALSLNPQTKLSWAQARQAAAQFGQSQSDYFPTFTGNFVYTRFRQPIFLQQITPTDLSFSGTPTSSTNVVVQDIYYSFWQPQLAVSYLLFDFGTRRATSEAARQALYSADWTHNNTIMMLLQTVMNDYYNYLYQSQLLIADEANVQTARVTLDAAKTGLDNGVRDISDYLQAKTQLLQNQTTWAAQQQNVETSYAVLLYDMGLPANMSLKTQKMPSTLPDSDFLPDVETLIAIAMQNRPDLLAAEANLHEQEANLTVAKTQFLPKLNYNFNIAKNYYSQNLHDKYNFMSSFSVSMPLFSGFYYRNAIKMAQAVKKEAEEQLKETELNVIKQITTYHYSVKVAFETVGFATAYLQAAQEEYTVSLSKYKQGTNTIVDVVNAQSSLADARARQINALQQWYTSLANLAYSTGILSPSQLAPFNLGTEAVADSQEEEHEKKQ